jgi:hypothetical protein
VGGTSPDSAQRLAFAVTRLVTAFLQTRHRDVQERGGGLDISYTKKLKGRFDKFCYIATDRLRQTVFNHSRFFGDHLANTRRANRNRLKPR